MGVGREGGGFVLPGCRAKASMPREERWEERWEERYPSLNNLQSNTYVGTSTGFKLQGF